MKNNRYKNPDYHKDYYQQHKEKINAQNQEWVADNPEKRRETNKRYREKNREQIRAKYHATRRDKTQSGVEPFLKSKLQRLRSRSKRNIAKGKYEEENNLTIEHLMDLWNQQQGRCALTSKKMTHCFNSLFAVSIDRIDSAVGYITGNVQLVCESINYAKSNFTNEQFVYFWTHNEECDERASILENREEANHSSSTARM